MITAVIPTKNRPNDLNKAVYSILTQSRLPDEIIIVDQSIGIESIQKVESTIKDNGFNKLIYIHDSTIKGLVDAKRIASERATGDTICFLEDDVILETSFLEQIEIGFLNNPQMLGCCGIITNPPKHYKGYVFLYNLFRTGIFHDPRVKIFSDLANYKTPLILSDVLSGGLSAWRSHIFTSVKFDVVNGLFMSEDIDFSTRVVSHFGRCLYINTNARVAHYCSPINREILGFRERKKILEQFIYYKKRNNIEGSLIRFSWLLFGLFFESIFQSIRSREISPVIGYFKGIFDGVNKNVIK